MLTALDRSLASLAYLQFYGAGSTTGQHTVTFQFPPRLVSDGKDIEWVEGALRGGEPLAFFKTAGARKIRLEWTYLIGESGGSGVGTSSGAAVNAAAKYWGVDDVVKEVAGTRWYFHNLGLGDNPADNTAAGTGAGGADAGLVAKFRLWHHGHIETPFSARLLAVDIKHGKTIFVPRDGGTPNPKKAFPLRTDIGIDLRLWTNSRDAEGNKQLLDELDNFVSMREWR